MKAAHTGVSGVPAAVPAVGSNNDHPPTSGGTRASIRATTTTRSTAPSSRIGRRTLSAVNASLSERDWHVLRTVASHRYLTTRQVEGFCFDGHATPLSAARVCRRVLRRLDHSHVLTHLERRIGGVRAGSASYVWQVGRVGDRLLREAADAPRKRQREPGLMFLDHCLAIADCHLALARASRTGDLELLRVETEPECWRPYTGLGGARLVVQPDLYAVTGAGEFEDHWFVEVDRGTEHPKRLLAKCHRYEGYRHSGVEQQSGGSFPLVVWVMRDEQQVARLSAAIRSDTSLDQRLYRITTAERLVELVRGGAV